MSIVERALIAELQARFNDLTVAYCGIVVPVGDGSLTRAIVDLVPNYSIIGIDPDEVVHEEFGTAGRTAREGNRLRILEGAEARVVVLRLGLRAAYDRLVPRRFDFMVWNDEDQSLLGVLSPLVRPGGLIALSSGFQWVLR